VDFSSSGVYAYSGNFDERSSMADETNWKIVRTVEEIETMADAWLASDDIVCPWSEGAALIFGSEAVWPLMLFVPKFVKDESDVECVDDTASALEHLQERIEFLIDKADNERGLSAPKAREQVCAYLWLFGREDSFGSAPSFVETASRARELLVEIQEQRQKVAST
jgi:hypothetical protein